MILIKWKTFVWPGCFLSRLKLITASKISHNPTPIYSHHALIPPENNQDEENKEHIFQ